MISKLSVKNYKSIFDDSIEFSNVNVLIGENGSGKSNYLEAMAMFSAANSNRLDISGLLEKGVRVTKPNLTLSSFLGKKNKNVIELNVIFKGLGQEVELKSNLIPEKENDIYTKWKDKNNINVEISESKQELLRKIAEENNEFLVKFGNSIFPYLEYRDSFFVPFLIYNLDTQALRGINNNSKVMPLGIYGEGLDVLLSDFSKEEWEELMGYNHLISWLDDIVIDKSDKLKFEGHKLGRSTSILYFRDKYMSRKNNVFAAENSNEGVLHILFYLALFISKKTPKFFAIDNIETALNPKLCRTIMKEIAALAVKHNKQVLITTHNPAILDGLNLNDDRQRLFIIKRTDEGFTKSERIKVKPSVDEKNLKLSEMWMRGYLGGLPTNF
jgi:predicted ATPase